MDINFYRSFTLSRRKTLFGCYNVLVMLPNNLSMGKFAFIFGLGFCIKKVWWRIVEICWCKFIKIVFGSFKLGDPIRLKKWVRLILVWLIHRIRPLLFVAFALAFMFTSRLSIYYSLVEWLYKLESYLFIININTKRKQMQLANKHFMKNCKALLFEKCSQIVFLCHTNTKKKIKHVLKEAEGIRLF